MKFKTFVFNAGAAVTMVAVVAGCSMIQGGKIDYRSASKGNSLEVPPDLTQISTDPRYNVPGGTVSATTLLATQIKRGTADNVAADTVADVQLHRDGDVRWLSVPRTPDKLWDPVREFWLNNGFTIAMDLPAIGIMETDWAENRAKLPQDFVRATLGKMLDSLYSTGERDKFRTRFERRADGGTDIYITHRGMVEEYTSSAQEQTIWKPRAVDPELETEFLRRLLVSLGITDEESRAVIEAGAATAAGAAATSRAVGVQEVQVNGIAALQLPEAFDRAWRRVGTALDRTGFTVEDRDRSQGIYFVRYIDPTAERKEPGFFGRMVGRTTEIPPLVKYRIVVQEQSGNSLVRVLTEAGQATSPEEAKSIVRLLYEDLR